MAVATLEDLQGTLEVVVFPRMYVTSGGTFAEGAILLVAGRIDHRGDEASLLADAVWVWEDAAARGPATIAQEVAAGDRGRGGGRRWPSGSGNGNGNGNGTKSAAAAPPPEASVAGAAVPPAIGVPSANAVPVGPKVRVSPLRGGGVTALAAAGPASTAPLAQVSSRGSPAVPAPQRSPAGEGLVPQRSAASAVPPAEPFSAPPEPEDFAVFAPDREEPPLPDEARAVAARASSAPTTPFEAPEAGVLRVGFTRGAGTDRIVWAMEELRSMLKERPGATRVVFNIPGPGGGTLPMEIRSGVAYDAEFLAEVRRRLGEGLVHVELSAGGGS
jgi:hypothetical protein